VTGITRSVVLIAATAGMGLSVLMCSADVLQRVGDDDTARGIQAAGEVRRNVLAQAVKTYQLAHWLEPWQPAHAFQLGRAYENSLMTLPPFSKEAQAVWASAAASYGQAVLLHPANGRLQAVLAWATLQNGDLISSRRAARAALKLAPDYPDVRYIVSCWYLAQWEALGADDQRLAIALVQRGARELPEHYTEVTWQFVRDRNAVRHILPRDLNIRRLLLKRLTEQRLFSDRWAELMDYPELRIQTQADGIHVIASGLLTGHQDAPRGATTVGSWNGMVTGWLSGGLVAKTEIDLPSGEVVLYMRIMGEPASGTWPTVSVTLGGQSLPFPPITGAGVHTGYFLVATPGGRMPLQAVLTNGVVILERGQFIERRAQLGLVKVLSPKDIIRTL